MSPQSPQPPPEGVPTVPYTPSYPSQAPSLPNQSPPQSYPTAQPAEQFVWNQSHSQTPSQTIQTNQPIQSDQNSQQPYYGQQHGQIIPTATPYGPQQPVQQYSPPPNRSAAGLAATNTVPPPPPRPETPYDFFMSSQSYQQKKGLFSARPLPDPSQGRTASSNKLLLIAAGGILLVLVLAVASLFIPKGNPRLELVAAAQSQNETLRVCNIGAKEAKLQSTRSFVTSCSLSLTSEQRQLLAQLSKAGVDVGGDQLDVGRNAKLDQQLKSASAASSFDEAFVIIAETQLNSYVRAMKRAATAPTTNDIEKTLLTKQFESSQLLLQQLKQPNP